MHTYTPHPARTVTPTNTTTDSTTTDSTTTDSTTPDVDDVTADADAIAAHAAATISAATGDRQRRSGRTRPEADRVLRCTSTAEFLAVLPFVTGFSDENSLFIVLFRGKRSEDVLRIPLPDQISPDAHQSDRDADLIERTHDGRANETAFIETIVELLASTGGGAHSPALVFTTALSFDECQDVPLLRLVRRVQRRLGREGWSLRELAVVASDGWSGLLNQAHPVRRPLAEITANPMRDRALGLAGPTRNLAELTQLPEPDEGRAARVAEALKTLETSEVDHSESTFLFERCLSVTTNAANLPHETLAILISAAQSPTKWLTLALTTLTSASFVATLSGTDGAQLFSKLSIAEPEPANGDAPQLVALERLLLTISTEHPELDGLRQATELLGEVAAHAPEASRPAVLALLAWAWWMLGLQSVAREFIAQAQRIDAHHALTNMMHRLLRHLPTSRLQARHQGDTPDHLVA